MRVMGSHTISTSRPRSVALFRSVVVAVAITSSALSQIGHLLRNYRIERPYARDVARRRTSFAAFGMRVRPDAVPTRFVSASPDLLFAAGRNALAGILRVALALHRDAVVVHSIWARLFFHVAHSS